MKKGVSLLELIVSSIISVIVIGSVNMYLMQGYRMNERIFLQSQAHAALALISRSIEDAVKNGASVSTNGTNELKIFDPNDNMMVMYRLENNSMKKYLPGETVGTNMVKFASILVEGDFALGLTGLFTLPDNTSATFNLKITINGTNSSYTINTQPFNSKCRNKIKA